MRTVSRGTSRIPSSVWVRVRSMLRTTSSPSTTRPKTAYPKASVRAVLVVEARVVLGVDEELRAGRIRFRPAGHGQRETTVLQIVGRLVEDAAAEPLGLRCDVRVESPTLDHEAADDPMKDRVVVEAVLHVSEKVDDRRRRVTAEQFADDVTLGRLDDDPRVGRRLLGLKRCTNQRDQGDQGERDGRSEHEAPRKCYLTLTDWMTTASFGTFWNGPRFADRNGRDLVDHLHTLRDATEDGVGRIPAGRYRDDPGSRHCPRY